MSYKVVMKNLASNGAGFLVEALISFLMLPFVVNRVGDDIYGLWAIVLSLSGYMGILNLGLRPAINKYVAEFNARGERHKIAELIRASIFLYSFCALLIMLLSVVLSVNLERFFAIPSHMLRDCKIIVLFTGVQMSLGLIAVVYGGIISGLQRYDINNGIEIFVMLTRTVLIIAALCYYRNIYALAVPHLLMTAAGYLLTYYYARRLFKPSGSKPLFARPDRNVLSLLLRFSSITFVISIVSRLLMYVDNLLIASLVSTTVVTYYVIGSRLVSYTRKMLEAFVSVLAPAVSEYHANDEMSRLRTVFIYSIKLSRLVAFPCLIFFLVCGRDFIRFWIGKESYESYQVLVVLSLAAFFTFPQLCTNPILYGINRHKVLLYVSVLEGGLSILLAVLLGSSYPLLRGVIGSNYELVGVAIGLAAPPVFLGSIIYPLHLAKVIGIGKAELWWTVYVEHAALYGSFALLLYLVNRVVAPGNIVTLLAEFACCMVVYLCFVWCFVLNEMQRETLRLRIPRLSLRSS